MHGAHGRARRAKAARVHNRMKALRRTIDRLDGTQGQSSKREWRVGRKVFPVLSLSTHSRRKWNSSAACKNCHCTKACCIKGDGAQSLNMLQGKEYRVLAKLKFENARADSRSFYEKGIADGARLSAVILFVSGFSNKLSFKTPLQEVSKHSRIKTFTCHRYIYAVLLNLVVLATAESRRD